MTKIAKERVGNFTHINNEVIRDKKLTWKAKGIFLYLWSLPDDWSYYETEVEKHASDKLASLKSGLKELETYGYLSRKRGRDTKGKLGESIWTLHEHPTCDYPTLDKPTLDNPTLDNHTLLSTECTNNLITNDVDEEMSAINFYDSIFGKSNSYVKTNLEKRLIEFNDAGEGNKIVCLAIEKTAAYDIKHSPYKYVISILNDWQKKGFKTLLECESDVRPKSRPNYAGNKKKEDIPDWLAKQLAEQEAEQPKGVVIPVIEKEKPKIKTDLATQKKIAQFRKELKGSEQR